MSNLNVNYASKKTGLFSKSYAISLTTVIDDENPIEDEIRHVNEAMLNWIGEYGKKCGTMIFVFTANEEDHQNILQNVNNLLNQDLDCSDIIKKLEVNILLLNMNGEICKELKAGLQN